MNNVHVQNVRVRRRYGELDVTGTIEITFDLDRIARQLAAKAFISKSRKSRVLNGAIVAKAHSIEEVVA
jgi:hypothetical protein